MGSNKNNNNKQRTMTGGGGGGGPNITVNIIVSGAILQRWETGQGK